MTKLCKTKPICWRCEIKASSVLTNTYEKKSTLTGNQGKAKQSQLKLKLMLRWVKLFLAVDNVEVAAAEPIVGKDTVISQIDVATVIKVGAKPNTFLEPLLAECCKVIEIN